MSIRKASAQTTVNRGTAAAAAATVNQITIAPATATSVAGGGSLGGGGTISNVAIMSDATFTTVLSGDTAVSTAGGFVRVTGSGFRTGANVFLNNVLCSNSFVSSTQINANIPASANGNYLFSVFNPDGSGSTWLPGLAVSGPPTWTSLAYSVNTLTLSIQLLATGDAPLTYYIQPGSSNPQNLAVSSSGLLTGTVPSDGAYSLTVIVDDAQNQSVQATITVTVQVTDPYFNLTTLALPGDGTNNANNQSFIDSSSNAFAITRNGNATQGTFSPFSQTGWSNYSDGTGDYLTWTGTTLSGDFTAECWVYKTAVNASGYTVVFGGPGNQQFSIDNTTAGSISLVLSGSVVIGASGTAVTLNAWHHLAYVRQGSTCRVYVNGVQQGTGTSSASVAISFIGQYDQGGFGLTGYISNVRVVAGTCLYPGGTTFTPSTSPLTAVANTSLLTCQSNRFVDNSTNAFAITRFGDISVQAFSPFLPTVAYTPQTIGGSGYFDGNDNLVLPLAVNSSIGALAGKQLTFEFWINTSEIAAVTAFNMGLFGNFVAVAVNARYGIFLTGSSTTSPQNVQFGWTTSPSAATNVTTTATLNQKSWNHVAITVNATTSSSTTIVIYLNGVGQTFTGQNLSSHTADPNYNFYVAETREGTQNFRGFMGGFKISTGIQRTGNFTPPTSPFTSDANTHLLLNFTNAGITDATAKNVLETVGDAKISTAQSKFGGSSMLFDGTGDYLFTPASPNNNLNIGDFTLEFWVYRTNLTGDVDPIGCGNSSNTGYQVRIKGTTGFVQFLVVGGASLTTTTGITAATWQHIAIVRSGTTVRMYINGVDAGGSGTVGNSGTVTTELLVIGANRFDYSNTLNGYIDDLRITRGFARYTANFTPPTAAFNLR